MIKRILLALGGTPFSRVAVRRGIELAQTHGSTLIGIPILDSDYWKIPTRSWMTASEAARMVNAKPWEAAERRVKRVLDDFEKACANAGVPCEVKRPEQRPFDMLASTSRYCDLVLFGLRGLFDFHLVPEAERTIAQLIRGGVRPILAVSSVYRPIRRVLIAYSGSMESARTIRQFVQMGLWPNATIELITFTDDVDDAPTLLTDAATYCKAHGHTPQMKAEAGTARQSLLPYAQETNADLIVAGDSFRNVVLRDLLGDTMSHLIRHADRPLFLSH